MVLGYPNFSVMNGELIFFLFQLRTDLPLIKQLLSIYKNITSMVDVLFTEERREDKLTLPFVFLLPNSTQTTSGMEDGDLFGNVPSLVMEVSLLKEILNCKFTTLKMVMSN